MFVYIMLYTFVFLSNCTFNSNGIAVDLIAGCTWGRKYSHNANTASFDSL